MSARPGRRWPPPGTPAPTTRSATMPWLAIVERALSSPSAAPTCRRVAACATSTRCPGRDAALDRSSLRWLGISDLIAEPEGPTFISSTVAQRRLDRRLLVTQDPKETWRTHLQKLGKLIPADDHERRPVGRMGLVRLTPIDQRQHRAAQRLRAAGAPGGSHAGERLADEFDSCVGIDRPMRDK